MNIFTNDDYRRIQAWLKANAIKDSDFTISENTVPDEDILVITQNVSTIPTNYRIKIKDLLNSSLGKIVIDKITTNVVKVNNTLTVDAANVKLDNEKGTTLQDIIDWTETLEKAAKEWNIEYQVPSIDEPTVRAKYVLKDSKGVPKGDVIKVYKDSAITNVYLGTTKDTCNENTGEVTKEPVQDNNEALSIVYRLDTGKYSLVNVPIGIFTREAEFDKYKGLGVTENGQVFVKLASDVESSNYLHFNDMGEVSADGIENRILQDLGTIINSVANDGTMWGQYKKEEGTKDSPINEASRWGQYKQAEADRSELLNIVSSKVNQLEQEQIQGGVYDVSAHNDDAVFESLSALLNSSDLNALIPTSVRHGGMSIRFIQSSDNKYVQFRCIANEFTTDVTKWQNIGNFLEEKETSYSEEDVAEYITDKKGTIVARLMKNGAVDWTVKNNRDIFVDGKISDIEEIEEFIQDVSGNLNTQIERVDELDGNAIKEVPIDDVEDGVAGYITGKNGVIISKLMKNGAIECLVKNSRDAKVGNAIIELGNRIVAEKDRAEGAEHTLQNNIDAEKTRAKKAEHELLNNIDQNCLKEFAVNIEDDNIVSYITDKNKSILAKINKDGSVDRLVENDRDKHTVHFEDVDIEGIANLLTDKYKKIIASINDKAEVDFYGGGGFAGEKTTEAKTGEYVRLLVSKNKVVIGGVKKDGTVHLFKAKIDNLDTEVDINITALINALPVIASGLNNVEISNDQRIINLLTSVNSTKVIDIKGANIKSKLKPIMSIVDDDTIDGQIPSSMGSSIPNNHIGGYFSVLLPIILSLNDKYEINAKVGLACEGHRVGLTSYLQPNDNYSQLNDNGNYVKLLNTKLGWDILNHSMTAQLPINSYGVDSINSVLADQILSEGIYVRNLSFRNTIVLDKSTGKWYEVNSTKTAWVERVPTKKYAMLYYRDYGTNKYHINRDFDFNYSWGEWFKRAKELGLPYKSCIVYNGSTTSPFTIAASRKYAEFSIRTNLNRTNVPPIPAAVARYNIVQSSDSNAEVEATTEKMKRLVDECYSKHSWLVWMSHANDIPLQNRYNTGVDYGSKKDDNYSSEWEIPLNASEITTMDKNNYWVNPPARLGISRWKDWHPAPGTQIGAFYEVLEYAISKGIDIVTPTEGWSTHGNLMQIGVDMMDTNAIYDIVDAYTDTEQSFITVGADGSIRYFSK